MRQTKSLKKVQLYVMREIKMLFRSRTGIRLILTVNADLIGSLSAAACVQSDLWFLSVTKHPENIQKQVRQPVE